MALTPARLADAFKGANQSLSGNGYQKLPGGLIIQWGTGNAGGDPVHNSFGRTAVRFRENSYPIAFPNALLSLVATHNHGGGTTVAVFTRDETATGFSAAASWQDDISIHWIAIGY